jgi:hypothetical protein
MVTADRAAARSVARSAGGTVDGTPEAAPQTDRHTFGEVGGAYADRFPLAAIRSPARSQARAQ